MAIITIDTEKDSRQTLRKVIAFLQSFVDERPQWGSSESSSASSVGPQPAADMFSMFSDTTSSQHTSVPDTSASFMSAQILLDDTPSDGSDDDDDEPRIISY